MKTYLALLGALVFWSSAFVGIRWALLSYSPGALAVTRQVMAACFFLIVFFFRKRKPFHWKDALGAIVLGALGIGVYAIFLNKGEMHISASLSSFIVGMAPILNTALAVLFLNEKVSKYLILGIVISTFGMLMIAFNDISSLDRTHIGLVWVCMATALGSLYAVGQKPILKRMEPYTFATFAFIGSALSVLYFMPVGIREVLERPKDFYIVLYLALFPSFVSYFCWSYALSKFPVSKASTSLYAMPFLATLFEVALFKELPTLFALVGGIFALLGALIVAIPRKGNPPS